MPAIEGHAKAIANDIKARYLCCQKKRNNPRLDIRICTKKCSLKDDCEKYLKMKEEGDENIISN